MSRWTTDFRAGRTAVHPAAARASRAYVDNVNTTRQSLAGSIAAALVGCQVLVSCVAVVSVFFQGMSISHCGSRCDFTLLYWAWLGFVIFAAVLLLASIFGSVLLRQRGWWVVAPPIVSLLVVILGAPVATEISRAAMLFQIVRR